MQFSLLALIHNKMATWIQLCKIIADYAPKWDLKGKEKNSFDPLTYIASPKVKEDSGLKATFISCDSGSGAMSKENNWWVAKEGKESQKIAGPWAPPVLLLRCHLGSLVGLEPITEILREDCNAKSILFRAF